MAIKDWRTDSNGRIWGQIVAIRDVVWQRERAKGPKLNLEVFDATGACKAKMWTPTPEQARLIVETASAERPVLSVSGTVTLTGAYAGELTIEGVIPVEWDESLDLAAFQEPLPLNHELHVQTLDRLIRSVREPHLSLLLVQAIGPEGKWRDRYLTATAAKTNHHAYPGGLVHHSVEVANNALNIGRQYPGLLNHDLLVTAALLHDIGKLWEMEQDGWKSGQYTHAGNLLGHVFMGGSRLERICGTLRFPEDLRNHLIHAILAHHEELEYGSPVRPMTPEAILLAKCDQISAELTQYSNMQTQQSGIETGQLVRRGDRSFFIGRREWEGCSSPEESLPEDPEERLIQRLMGKVSHAFGGTAMLGANGVRIPLLGVVAAGDGIRSSCEEEEPEEFEVILPPGGADFLLRVTGDSMTGAGIYEGDLLMVRRQETARIGEIVIALVPEAGPVVKRLTEDAGGRFLTSENPNYSPIPVTEEVRVQGVVVRLERELYR